MPVVFSERRKWTRRVRGKKLSLLLSALYNNTLHVSGFPTVKQKLTKQQKALHKYVQFSSKAHFSTQDGGGLLWSESKELSKKMSVPNGVWLWEQSTSKAGASR